MYSFCENVLDATQSYGNCQKIEDLRRTLLSNTNTVEVTDLGAGSRSIATNTRIIKDIASTSLSPKFQCEFLNRLIHFAQPSSIIELGTSLGLSALYMKEGSPSSKLISLEGCPNIAKVASNNFQTVDPNSDIEIVVGNFNDTFGDVLGKLDSVDFVYFDGNHQEQPTIDYFHKALAYKNPNSIFLFDDIYWSKGMKSAWEQIKTHNSVKASIDLFYFGIILFKEDFQEKQDFRLIPKKYKPFKKGWI